MIKRYNALSFAFAIPGLLIRFLAFPVKSSMSSFPSLANGLSISIWLLGTVLLFAGFVFYLKSKGRSWLWALLSIFGILGLLVMACLKDKKSPPPLYEPPRQCPSCQTTYRLSDYDPNAQQIFCPKCKALLRKD